MRPVPIPNWNAQGVLPPNNPVSPTSAERSPYVIKLTDLILRYASTPHRNTILQGFLNFRKTLHSIGLVQGFQWLDGSFLEHIELIETRQPGDIDVVTFYHLPEGVTQKSLFSSNPRIFTSQHSKEDHKVDAHFVQLNLANPDFLIQQATYWYSLWSHRRNDVWKGYLQIDLSPSEDDAAQANLATISTQGGQS